MTAGGKYVALEQVFTYTGKLKFFSELDLSQNFPAKGRERENRGT